MGNESIRGDARQPVWEAVDARVHIAGGAICTKAQAAFRSAFALPAVDRIAVGTENLTHLRELVMASTLRGWTRTPCPPNRGLLRNAQHQPAAQLAKARRDIRWLQPARSEPARRARRGRESLVERTDDLVVRLDRLVVFEDEAVVLAFQQYERLVGIEAEVGERPSQPRMCPMCGRHDPDRDFWAGRQPQKVPGLLGVCLLGADAQAERELVEIDDASQARMKLLLPLAVCLQPRVPLRATRR
jgi:hypothetical protein